ncbi:hypothetical protein PL9214650360 [Planktothrix tepida PCC 9214]|uniref:Uncharacterized protein n=1 Tax=Planktothrix tepida PCC 9214 TaxID=671072 RepID=A0A1J1LTP0_9CYAN|nr:hypothetical protein PL9214650360 [Planktothrix tepida PCC 9214]
MCFCSEDGFDQNTAPMSFEKGLTLDQLSPVPEIFPAFELQ